MAAMDLFSKGNQSFVDENYQEAVDLYSAAIAEDNSQADFYANRANAYLKIDINEEAVKDACQALTLNPKHSKALLRKGMGLFNLENYAEAKGAFAECKTDDGADKNIDMWIRKCQAELDLKSNSAVGNGDASQVGSSEAPKELPMPTVPKTRYDWYQTEKMVIITIMLKAVAKEDLAVDIEENSVSARVKLPASRSDFTLDLELLHPINPERSCTKIMSTKVEIKLAKTEGIRWEKLERDHIAEPAAATKVKHFNQADSATADVTKYPSSSQNTVNWDKLVTEIKAEEKDEKLEGDAALNNLFQTIYSDGNDETRKAMNKSFIESGGTVLSTNWKDIKQKPVEVKPPDGMEYKKWQPSPEKSTE